LLLAIALDLVRETRGSERDLGGEGGGA